MWERETNEKNENERSRELNRPYVIHFSITFSLCIHKHKYIYIYILAYKMSVIYIFDETQSAVSTIYHHEKNDPIQSTRRKIL